MKSKFLLQNYRYRNSIIASIFIFISLALLSLPIDYRVKISSLTSPISLKPLQIVKERLLLFKNLQKERDELYNLCLQLKLSQAALKDSLQRLTEKPPQQFLDNYLLKKAQITARDASLKRYFVIDKGEGDGVKVNTPVLSKDGILGKVISTQKNTSIVETFFSPYLKISVRVARNNYLCALSTKNGILKLDYVEPTADIQVNDTIVSSDLGGIFPNGIKIGLVEKIINKTGMFADIQVRPFPNLLTINEVYLLLGEKKKKKPSLEKMEIDQLLEKLEIRLPDMKINER